MQQSLNSWNRRNISKLGRATIVKSLILSKVVDIVHLLLVQIPPENVREKINAIIFKFIWKNKIEKVKRNNVIVIRRWRYSYVKCSYAVQKKCFKMDATVG